MFVSRTLLDAVSVDLEIPVSKRLGNLDGVVDGSWKNHRVVLQPHAWIASIVVTRLTIHGSTLAPA